MRVRRFALIWSLAVALLPAANAEEIKIMSLNMLRFGHGQRFEKQCEWLRANGREYDIILLQEVMISDASAAEGQDSHTNHYPCLRDYNTKNVNITEPADQHKNSYGYIGSPLKGKSSYKEAYGFLFNRETFVKQSGSVQFDSIPNNYMRPPHFIKLSKQGNVDCQIIVGNFHSVYGKEKQNRVSEAKAIIQDIKVLAYKNAKFPVVLGGDWNLTGSEINEQNTSKRKLQDQITVTIAQDAANPDPKTTLNSNGDLANSYDHFAVAASSSTTTIIKSLNTFPAQNASGQDLSAHRLNISDHVAITATITLPCNIP